MSEEKIEIEQPKDLEGCFAYLNEHLKDKAMFKDTLEDNIHGMTHFSMGMWMRNNWHLWWSPELASRFVDKGYPQEKPALVKYFNEVLNIDHADDMSGIIIQSYHRHLNGKELNLEAQVKRYHNHWKKVKGVDNQPDTDKGTE